MQPNIALLAKRAIGEALKANWTVAIELNSQILQKDPSNIDAKLRLGRAYIQLKQLPKAKKLFKEVIAVDPINSVALKNLEMINSNKIDVKSGPVDPKFLIKEPGTTAEVSVKITAKGITSDSFLNGEKVTLKIKKHSVDLFKSRKDTEVLFGTIENQDTVKKLNNAKDKEAEVSASFIRGKEKDAVVLIKASVPVFRSEKQDIRPYIKKGTIDDQEMELDELELPLE